MCLLRVPIILSTLDNEFLFNYLHLWRSYAILSATTQRAFRPMVDILNTYDGGRDSALNMA